MKKPVVRKIVLAIALVAILLVYFFFDARKGLFPECPFHLLTSLYCPGCGSQRALSALLHGDVISAFRFNILLVIFLPLLLYTAMVYLRYASIEKIKLWYHPLFGRLIILCIICFWVLRNIPAVPFNALRP